MLCDISCGFACILPLSIYFVTASFLSCLVPWFICVISFYFCPCLIPLYVFAFLFLAFRRFVVFPAFHFLLYFEAGNRPPARRRRCRGSISGKSYNFYFLFYRWSRTALKPAQPPTLCGLLPVEQRRWARRQILPYSTKVKNAWNLPPIVHTLSLLMLN
jgi:hypothetical protein